VQIVDDAMVIVVGGLRIADRHRRLISTWSIDDLFVVGNATVKLIVDITLFYIIEVFLFFIQWLIDIVNRRRRWIVDRRHGRLLLLSLLFLPCR
jgi:hypothetical protein